MSPVWPWRRLTTVRQWRVSEKKRSVDEGTNVWQIWRQRRQFQLANYGLKVAVLGQTIGNIGENCAFDRRRHNCQTIFICSSTPYLPLLLRLLQKANFDFTEA